MSDPASSDVLRDERFIEVADAAPVILWRIDSSFEHDWVNRRWFDYTGGRLVDEKAFAWAARIHPDDRDRVLEELDRAFNAREATAVEFRLLGKDRAYRWFLDRAEPFFRDGAFAGFVGGCVDVTERVEAEKLAAALQAELAELSCQAAMGGLGVALAHDLAIRWTRSMSRPSG
jgi:PAS domain S-box-containing protein